MIHHLTKNLAKVNNCYRIQCKSKKKKEIEIVKYQSITEHNILNIIANCKQYDNKVIKTIDYSKFENIKKKGNLYLLLQKDIQYDMS